MKKADVQIGATYLVKVGGNLVPATIDGEHPSGGWTGTSCKTGKTIRIKSPQRLRKPVADASHLKAIHKADQENARLVETRAKTADGQTASERAMAGPATPARKVKGSRTSADVRPGREATGKSAKDAKPGLEPDVGEPAATEGKPLSLIRAAAIVLDVCDRPLSCKEIVEKAIETGAWTPRTGKTPANTLYAAILREIKTKGGDARFVKVERGKFALAGKQ